MGNSLVLLTMSISPSRQQKYTKYGNIKLQCKSGISDQTAQTWLSPVSTALTWQTAPICHKQAGAGQEGRDTPAHTSRWAQSRIQSLHHF